MSGDALGLLTRVIDQLRFDELVEEGGFGYVYRGIHLGLDEPVAIKCLKNRFGDDPELAESFSRRFRDETKIAYRLSQGNLDIVRSISSGTLTTPAGMDVPYMVLEWLDGHSLMAELVDRRASANPRMSVVDAVKLLDSAAVAIGFAHTQGVVHRDIKPGNLFLADTRTGLRLKVLDFGLAKIVDPDGFMAPSGAQTGANVFIASPSYGAPEQFSKKNGTIGPWTDVYSFALVMLEMIAGKKVRHADNLVEGMVRALAEDSGSPTPRKLGIHVSDQIEAVFTRATALDASRRYKDLNEFWHELRDAMMSLPEARDALATIATHEGSATAEARDRAMAAYDAQERERQVSQSAATRVVPSPSAPPSPAANANQTQRLSAVATPQFAQAAQAAQAALGAMAAQGGSNAPAAQNLGNKTVPIGQNFQSLASLPLSSRGGNIQPPPSSQPQMTGTPLPLPNHALAPALMRAPPRASRSRKRKPRLPLWATLLIAAVLGATGAFAIVYTLKTKK